MLLVLLQKYRLGKIIFFSLFFSMVMLCDRSLAKESIVSEAQIHEEASSINSDLIREDTFVTSDPDVQIFVREVRSSSNLESDRVPILLIHGGGSGSVTSFDINVPGYSVAADLAAKGHQVYLMNVRGWERSTRPASFDEPPEENPPAVTSEQAVLDISAVVDWINQQNQSSKVALLGWATGGHWAGMYTSRNNDKVSHLIMLNSLYGVDAPWELNKAFENPNQPGQFDASTGAYRLANAKGLLAKWDETIPATDKSQWREEAVAKAYQRSALASDPTSNTRQPPSLRIPAAYRQESYNLANGKKYWNAKDITVPTLVIRGKRDFWSRPADMKALKAELVNAPRVETETIPNGTHYLFLDLPKRGRDRFIQEVVLFLEE